MKTAAYLIRCLTNLHVGKGGANYDVVDNSVQRDVTTGLPCIFSSSLKGALRQFCASNDLLKEDLDYIFGPRTETKKPENKKKNEGQDDKKEDKNNDNGIGHFSFFQANLWAFPIRSDKEAKGYTLTTNANWQEKITSLADALKVKPDYSKAGVSPERKEKEVVEEVDHLPVIARNCLDNGESKNIWYEEVVPAESCFVFFISYDDEEKFKLFDEKIQSKPVQIGANGSIGYGFCSIKNISKYDEQ